MFDQLREKLEKQVHKATVQQTIFCPVCDHVLDAKKSTSITVWRNNSMVYSKVFCTAHLQPDYRQAQQNLCAKNGLRAEIFHGKTGKLEIIE